MPHNKRSSTSPEAASSASRQVRRRVAEFACFMEGLALESEQEMDKLKAVHALVVDELRAVSKRLEDANDEVDARHTELCEARRTIEDKEFTIRDLSALLAWSKRLIEKYQRSQLTARSTVDACDETVAKLAEQVQTMGRTLQTCLAEKAELRRMLDANKPNALSRIVDSAQTHFVDCITLEITAACVPMTSGQVDVCFRILLQCPL